MFPTSGPAFVTFPTTTIQHYKAGGTSQQYLDILHEEKFPGLFTDISTSILLKSQSIEETVTANLRASARDQPAPGSRTKADVTLFDSNRNNIAILEVKMDVVWNQAERNHVQFFMLVLLHIVFFCKRHPDGLLAVDGLHVHHGFNHDQKLNLHGFPPEPSKVMLKQLMCFWLHATAEHRRQLHLNPGPQTGNEQVNALCWLPRWVFWLQHRLAAHKFTYT
ncbi:uncharacterized protein C8Q71DRAFT_722858 [Rhodofomes roseus]|uniref:Uncharacterized protein n=1 Tax=Rhodofomes roseus TaxID=34475 RepID=A0ABQ8KMA7_9APHY|nr:uncharacterized protein C8Q71DRAFT_722858 [Rhodofomes roseus]KAH9838766.1 hypothetical protein C8Q71DRAFT_722858 [Rhodofomes roseus]